MPEKNHVQCSLRKESRHTVAWIPERYAIVGKVVKLLDEDGWEVIEAYNRMASAYVNERSQDHKRHRKATDI